MVSTMTRLCFLLQVAASCLAAAAASYTPSPTYPNGTANPYYPCGTTASEVAACPYRCYTSSGSLLDQCYNEDSAKAAINSLNNICVQCVVPEAPEDYPGGCQPLSTYFDGSQNPSPCGFLNHRLRSCAWICAEAQVPFEVCSVTNTTGEFSLCTPCVPQCSSPRIVFEPPFLPSNFSIAAGSCSAEYGEQEIVACLFRCSFAGYPSADQFCSLTDKTSPPDSDGFTTCTSCK